MALIPPGSLVEEVRRERAHEWLVAEAEHCPNQSNLFLQALLAAILTVKLTKR